MKERLDKTLELRYHYVSLDEESLITSDNVDFIFPPLIPTFIAVLEKIMDNNPQEVWEEVLTGMINNPEYDYGRFYNLIADLIHYYIQMLVAKRVDPPSKFSTQFLENENISKRTFVLSKVRELIENIEKRRLDSLEKTKRGRLAAAELRLIQGRMLKEVGLPVEIADAVHEATKTVSTTPAAVESTIRTHLQPAGIRSDMTLEEKIAEYDRLIEENPNLTQFFEKAKQKARARLEHETAGAEGGAGGASRAGGASASLGPS